MGIHKLSTTLEEADFELHIHNIIQYMSYKIEMRWRNALPSSTRAVSGDLERF
jgi:hypothetical protein